MPHVVEAIQLQSGLSKGGQAVDFSLPAQSSVFSQLSEQMNAEKVLVKSFRGLCTRLQNKILGHNLRMAFNSIFCEACDIRKIKQLVF